MKYLVFITGLIASLSGCTKIASPEDNLSCHLDIKERLSCSPVLSLISGNLKLNSANHHFELTAHYEACYQAEDINITGQYRQRIQKDRYNIELLARETFPRTIGLINLNIDTKKGDFIDIWALIRARDVKAEGLEKVDVNCQLSVNKDVDNES